MKHTTHDSIAWRTSLSRNNAVSIFCMILSVCHIPVGGFRPTRLCKTALNYWGLQAFVMRSIRSSHSISIRLVFGLPAAFLVCLSNGVLTVGQMASHFTLVHILCICWVCFFLFSLAVCTVRPWDQQSAFDFIEVIAFDWIWFISVVSAF